MVPFELLCLGVLPSEDCFPLTQLQGRLGNVVYSFPPSFHPSPPLPPLFFITHPCLSAIFSLFLYSALKKIKFIAKVKSRTDIGQAASCVFTIMFKIKK